MDIFYTFFPGAISMWNPKMRFVFDTINSDDVVMFSKSQCPYCQLAKDIFHKLRQPYTVVELDRRRDGDQIQDVLQRLTGARSVPRVFIYGRFVGGASEIKEMYENGRLTKLLGI